MDNIKKNGIYDEMKALLERAGKKVVDFILAVGGGSVIDCCKVVSAQAMLDVDVTTLLSQISWSNHLAIIAIAKTPEERHFYICYPRKNCSLSR